VVEGSVRKVAGRVRISAQLIDATTGHHEWAEWYDHKLRHLFALQDEITEALVASIFPELDRSERERASRKEPQSLDAWEFAMRGWWHVHKATKGDNAKARSLLKKAVKLDPLLLAAFAGLSRTHYNDIIFQWTDSLARSVSQTLRAAEECLRIDDRDHMGHIALGLACTATGERGKALSAFKLALQHNPNSSTSYFYVGTALAIGGSPDEGIENLQKAMSLSPQDPMMWSYLGSMAMAHFAAGRYEQAVDWASRSLQRKADWPLTLSTLAASYAQLGRLDEARAAVGALRKLSPGFSLAGLEPLLSGADPAFAERAIDGLRMAGLRE
jgi:tetratricopeptide (TPR) repeat protein